MPEHDVTKHTKAIYDTIREPGKTWKQKVGDVLVEIAIIVFAITLSLLLERWREDAHDRSTEKKFLLGLRIDLENDIKQLKQDSASYHNLFTGWMYLRNAGVNKIGLSRDSLSKYANSLTSTTEFIPNDSRYQALKSSGEFNVIENDSLQNSILDLYQNRIASLKLTTDYITQFKTQQMMPFLSKNIRYGKGDTTTNIQDLVEMPEMQNYLLIGGFGLEATQRYHIIIVESMKIIDIINKQYKKQ